MAPRWLLVVAAVAAAVTVVGAGVWPVHAAGPQARWSKIDYDLVDAQWSESDDPELLVTEDERVIQEMERRKAESGVPGEEGGDPVEWIAHTQASAGPTMMFAELVPNNPATRQPWTDHELKVLAAQWRDQLDIGGIEATCYALDGRILATLQKGWNGFELKDFLLTRDIVVEVEWNKIKYRPENMENDRLGRPPKSKKKEKKTKKKSKSKSKKKRKVQAKAGSPASKNSKKSKQRKHP